MTVQTAHTKEEIAQLCGFVPDYLSPNEPARIVTIVGGMGCPCGGTHVTNTQEIGNMQIRKITCRKGLVRIGYKLEE